MSIIEMLLLGIGLAMDAAAVSMSNGLKETKISLKKILLIGLFFGLFQGIMPLIGYFVGLGFSRFIESIAPWVALILLGFLGFNMIYEAIKGEEVYNNGLNIKTLFVQSIATSIDALAVGITFVATGMRCYDITSIGNNLYFGVLVIGVVTFIISVISVFIGKKFGNLFSNKATFIGGLILVGIGIKIFIEGIFL